MRITALRLPLQIAGGEDDETEHSLPADQGALNLIYRSLERTIYVELPAIPWPSTQSAYQFLTLSEDTPAMLCPFKQGHTVEVAYAF